MSDPTDTAAALGKPFPKNAIKTRAGGGGKSLSYVETHVVIHRLNDATGNHWDFRLTRLDQVGDLYVAVGELTIPGLGTRTGIGVQRVVERSGEDLVKGAASDCLKKCATLFGVGLELYGPDYEAGQIADKPAASSGQQHRQLAPQQAQQQQQKPVNTPAESRADAVTVTDQQRKRIEAVAKERGLNHDDWKAVASAWFGVESTTHLTQVEADKLEQYLKNTSPDALSRALAKAGITWPRTPNAEPATADEVNAFLDAQTDMQIGVPVSGDPDRWTS